MDELRVKATIDTGQFNAGMEGAANTVKTATSEMSSAFMRSATASLQLQKAQQELSRITAAVRDGQLTASEAASLYATALQKETASAEIAARAQDQLNAALGKSQVNFTEARHGAKAFSEVIDTKMNRGMMSLAAHSSIIGPILEKAFPILGVIMFVEWAEKAGVAIAELISKTFIFTEAQRELYNETIKENQKLAEMSEKTKGLKNDLFSMTHTGVETARHSMAEHGKEIDRLKVKFDELQKKLADTRTKMAETQKESVMTPGGVPQITTVPTAGAKAAVGEYQKLGNELMSVVAQLNQLGVEADIDKAKLTDAAKKAADEWDKTNKKMIEAILRLRGETVGNQASIVKVIDASNKEIERSTDQRLHAELTAEEQKNEKIIKAYEDQVRRAEETIDHERRIASIDVQIWQGTENQNIAAGRRGARDRETIAVQAENRMYQIELTALQQKLMLYLKDSDDYRKTRHQIEELERQHQAKLTTINRQAAQQRMQIEQTIQGQLNALWQGGWAGLLQSLTATLGQMLSKIVAHELATLVIHITTNQAKVASDATAAAESNTIGSMLGLKQVARDAAKAASGAYSAVVGIPFIGPILAPIAAAAAFTAVMAFRALAGAEKGAFIENDTPLIAHKGEMILPADLTLGMKKVISSFSPNPVIGGPATSSIAASGVAFNQPQHGTNIFNARVSVSAIDSRDASRFFRQNRGQLRQMGNQMMRHGAFNRSRL